VDDTKTAESRKSLVVAGELLDRLTVWKQATEFPEGGDWIFASPRKIGNGGYARGARQDRANGIASGVNGTGASQPAERMAPQVGFEPTTLRLTAELGATQQTRGDN
jgi:hypothetical protein